MNRRPSAIKSLISEFRYPRLGPGQMWEACRDLIEATGNEVLLRHRVTSVERVGDRVVGVRAATPEGPRTFPADHVISSTDLRTLVRILDPAAPVIFAPRPQTPEELRAQVEAIATAAPDVMTKVLVEAARDFSGGPATDDLAVLVLRRRA